MSSDNEVTTTLASTKTSTTGTIDEVTPPTFKGTDMPESTHYREQEEESPSTRAVNELT